MAAAAAPYVAWLSATAGQAEQAAAQARAAAAAFEAAFAETVSPAVVTANRVRLTVLIATNFLGQNSPAIMAAEAQYIEMWAQDVTAMYGYAGSSASASQLSPFSAPPQTVDPAGAAGQAAVVAHATGIASQAPAPTLPQLMSAVPFSLQSVTAPTASAIAADPSAPASLAAALNAITGYISGPTSPLSYFTLIGLPELLGAQCYLLPQALGNLADSADKLAAAVPVNSAALLDSQTGGLGSAASASLGRAGFVGGLSVPQGWAMAAPAVKPVAAVWSETGLPGASATAATQGEGTLFGNMALSSLAGRAMVSTGGTAGRSAGAAGPAAGEASGPVNIFIVPAVPQ